MLNVEGGMGWTADAHAHRTLLAGMPVCGLIFVPYCHHIVTLLLVLKAMYSREIWRLTCAGLPVRMHGARFS